MALAKMRRVFLVGPSDQKNKTMRFLQETGILHIEPEVKLAGEMEKQYGTVQQQVRRIGQVCEGMSHFKKGKEEIAVSVSDDELVSFCESRLLALQELQGRRQSLVKLIRDLELWGDFDPRSLLDLEAEGVFVQRFRGEGKVSKGFELPENVYTEIVSTKPVLSFFTIHVGGPVQIPRAVQLRHPEMGLKEAEEELKALQEEEKRIVGECMALSDRIEVLRGLHNMAVNEASYTEHLGTIYSEGHLFGLQGWIPADMEDGLFEAIKSSRLPLMTTTRDPLEDEAPPTLFRNNSFIRRIEPLLQLYGLPAYRSIDPSYFLAPFMIIFFGICLGDAGYGFVFLLLSSWFKRKWRHRGEAFSLAMALCQAFSISTIVVGLLTGSVFGYDFQNRGWILVDLDITKGNPMILFYASLGLGVLHLSLSYLLGMLDARSPYDFFQKVGLMLVLWGGSLLISRSIWFSDPVSALNLLFNYGGWGLLIIGLLVSFFSASDSKKWGVRIGLGFWSIYGLTGLIGDLLSYARLFGLGIATTAIAAVMNQLAGMIREVAGPVMGTVFAVILLLLGHGFNFAISILGSTVHSARLHFVEAFKSFFQEGGVQYKPFRIERG